MERGGELDEKHVLDAVVVCFWNRGFEATSMGHLVDQTGICASSLQAAFGDKASIYGRAMDHYIEASLTSRIERLVGLPPRDGIHAFFVEIMDWLVGDRPGGGHMPLSPLLDVIPRDPGFRDLVRAELQGLEAFFVRCVQEGQMLGAISRVSTAENLSKHLLGIYLGIRVMARLHPERALLERAIRPALALLDSSADDK